jgi:hypothetical protein
VFPTPVSFLALMMTPPIMQMVLSAANQKPRFILTYSGDLITSVLDEARKED